MAQARVSELVLLVDDEPKVLSGYRRNLEDSFAVATAPSGPEALSLLDNREQTYAVVVSDMRMPGMDGIEFLSKVKEVSPDTVRMMLTGYADVEVAISSVNEGAVFRFLTKPCPPPTLIRALVDGIRQFRLLTSERELLEKTLTSCLDVFSNLLSVVKPDTFGRSQRIATLAGKLASILAVENYWEVSVAASLSQIGLISLPDAIIHRLGKGWVLSGEQKAQFDKHPRMVADLIARIPRMERVAEIVAYQEKLFDGSGVPDDGRKGDDLPEGARILKVAIDYENLVASKMEPGEALRVLRSRKGWYDHDVVQALGSLLGAQAKFAVKELEVHELKPFMILAQDIYSQRPSRLLLSKGQELSDQVIAVLRRFRHTVGVRQPITVVCPLWMKAEEEE